MLSPIIISNVPVNIMYSTPLSIKVVSIAVPLLLGAGPILPNRDQQVNVIRIPDAISKVHPLPQEELFTAYSRGNSYLMEEI